MSKSSVEHPRSASYNSTEDEVDIDEEPVDTGLIRCICTSSEDDGFTIQCERCLVWQHAFCVRISQNNIPEHYLCDQCERKFGNPSTNVAWRDQLEQFSKAVENDVRSVLDKKLRQRVDFKDNGADKQHFRDIYNRIGDDDDYKPGVPNRRPSNQPKKNPVGRPPKKPKLSKKISVSKRSLQELQGDYERRKRPQKDEPVFQRISRNLVRSKHAKQVFKECRERWHRLEKGKEKAVNGTTPTREPVQHIVTDDSLEKDTKRASVRPLSKRWQYSSSEHQGLFADTDIARNQLIVQVNGDVLLKSEYKFDATNDFAVLGTPCAHVFFYPTLDLCIDARCRGNDGRNIRRSCHPNAELRGIIATQDQEIRLGLFARKDIKQDDELTIGWNWQRGHISWKKNLEWHDCGMTDGHQVIDEEEERGSRSALTRMLNRFSKEFGHCACEDVNLCFIEHLKAIISGSDKTPLTSFRSSKQDVALNGTASRAEADLSRAASRERSAQPSRQTIVSGTESQAKPEDKGQPTESGEDSIVIDVVSTSPLVRSPVIATPARVSDTEDELDTDGDIDVGDETMDYVPTAPLRLSSSERSLSRASSVSSYSGTEGEGRNGKRFRRLKKVNGEKPSKRQSIGPQDDSDMPGPTKLPCKKAWMRNFMQKAPSATVVAGDPMDISKDEPPEIPSEKKEETLVAEQASTKSEPESAVKEESETNHTIETKPSLPAPPAPSPPPPTTIQQPIITPTAIMDIEDDGELSDASSASTIPIIEQEDDRLNDLTVQEDRREESPSQQIDDTEALSSETDEQLKPTKVKLSLQEYLARRGTSGQKVGNGDKSQDYSANTEEHSWMTATNQVEVTMEMRQREAQH